MYMLPRLYNDGIWYLAAAIAIVTVIINVVFLVDDLYPLRWISPGLALMILLVIYPVFFTFYTAFTNYGDGHLLTKPQALQIITRELYLPEGTGTFKWTVFRSPEGDLALWLEPTSEGGTALFVPQDGEPVDVSGEPPESYQGYERLERRDIIPLLNQLSDMKFGVAPDQFKISSPSTAAQFQRRYVYDPEQDVIVDQVSGKVYRPVEGTFTADDGDQLRPGYQVVIGLKNFQRLVTSPALRGPFIQVFIWTILFAFFSVLTTFALGLFLAIAFNAPDMPMRKLSRSILLIPYAIPAFISVPIWVGMLNPHLGVISTNLEALFGWSPAWFADPTWAKIGIILVNLWLGFPYMFLITTGALQAVPQDMYEAADIDGATAWAKFWYLTLPMLLFSVGPLLVASFAFNFNNFVIIDLYNEGGPPISGTPTPAGHTDILVSYTYRLAFASGRGADLGYAAAITMAIFLILAIIVFIQFRYTNMLEEASENV
jgi:ABC-type sugar transport system permease subunit